MSLPELPQAKSPGHMSPADKVLQILSQNLIKILD
jgi:hypothetical protein